MIRAVIFDLGGTLEDIYYDDDLRLKAMPGLRSILAQYGLDPGLPTPELYAVIQAGMKKYNTWRLATERELPPERVWDEFILANYGFSKDQVYAAGEMLAFYWDTQFSRRTLRPEAIATLDALRQRGLRLGVISNIHSRGMVPFQLAQYGMTDYFQAVLASAVLGWRKPNPRIFLEMARLLELEPAQCAYVGDTISRDVVGARRAGYGLAIQIKSFLTAQADREIDTEPPDIVIQNLIQIVDIIQNALEHQK